MDVASFETCKYGLELVAKGASGGQLKACCRHREVGRPFLGLFGGFKRVSRFTDLSTFRDKNTRQGMARNLPDENYCRGCPYYLPR